jgi:hypothetical protein
MFHVRIAPKTGPRIARLCLRESPFIPFVAAGPAKRRLELWNWTLGLVMVLSRNTQDTHKIGSDREDI